MKPTKIVIKNKIKTKSKKSVSKDGDALSPQETFIKNCQLKAESSFKANKAVPLKNLPFKRVYLGINKEENLPELSQWYRNEVLLLVPHMNYPGLKFRCSCGGKFLPKQWAATRNIYGLVGQVSLCQYRYCKMFYIY